jgi:enoyl-CoA hydratase
MEERTASIEISGGIAIVLLDKPPVNAFDLRLVRDAEECLKGVEKDPNIRAVVIAGKGKCFSAGLDLKTVPFYTPAKQRKMVEDLNRTVAWLYGFSLPTVAAVNGHAIAGGFILAIACDYRVGTIASCRLGVTETRVGIPFPVSTMEVLRAELAPAVARSMTLAGRTIGPEYALANGVLDELRPTEEVLTRAKEVALEFAALPRKGYAKIKRQLRGETLARMEEALRTGSDPLLDMLVTEEGRAASTEHLERGGR